MSGEPHGARWRLPPLAVSIGFNGVAQVIPLVAAFAVTPLLLHRLGLSRYGIWSLALVILSTLAALDGGVSASLARFFAVYGARENRAAAGRLLLGSVLFFVLLGAAFTVLAIALAPTIVSAINVPHGLEAEATMVLRWLPALATLGLIADSIAAVLEGNGKFRSLAISTFLSSTTFVVLVVILVDRGPHLRELIIATAARYAVLGLASSLFARFHLAIRRPLLLARDTLAELWRFSSRMQLSALTGFVNSELDALVIAAVLPVRYVGLYGIGMQAASAARSLPLYAFSPLLTRLSRIFGTHGRDATASAFEELEQRWLATVFGYGVVALSAIGFSVTIWLGNSYRLAGIAAVILLSGYIVHVGLTGMRTCYVRAVGRPGLETRYSALWTVTNAIVTVPLALAGGLLGVVGATAGTGILASAYFVALCRRTERLGVILPGRSWAYSALAAAALTVCGELAILQLHTHGFFPLVLTGVPAILALLIIGLGGRARTLAVA